MDNYQHITLYLFSSYHSKIQVHLKSIQNHDLSSLHILQAKDLLHFEVDDLSLSHHTH